MTIRARAAWLSGLSIALLAAEHFAVAAASRHEFATALLSAGGGGLPLGALALGGIAAALRVGWIVVWPVIATPWAAMIAWDYVRTRSGASGARSSSPAPNQAPSSSSSRWA